MRVPEASLRPVADESERVVVTRGDVEVQHFMNFGTWKAARLFDPFTGAELGRQVEAVDHGYEGVALSIWNDGTATLAFVPTSSLTDVVDIGLMVDERDLSDDVLLRTRTSPIGDVKRDRIVQLVDTMVDGQEVRVQVRFGEEDEPDRVVIRVPLTIFRDTVRRWMFEVVDSECPQGEKQGA